MRQLSTKEKILFELIYASELISKEEKEFFLNILAQHKLPEETLDQQIAIYQESAKQHKKIEMDLFDKLLTQQLELNKRSDEHQKKFENTIKNMSPQEQKDIINKIKQIQHKTKNLQLQIQETDIELQETQEEHNLEQQINTL